MRAVVVNERKYNVANFHRENIRSFLDLVGAMGLSSPDELTPFHIHRRIANETEKTYGELYQYLEPGELIDASGSNNSFTKAWAAGRADAF